MRSKIIISLVKVEDFLLGDKKCTEDQREEIISTIKDIDAKEGRQWVFTSSENKYFIDEYNEYHDFVKTYTFKDEQ